MYSTLPARPARFPNAPHVKNQSTLAVDPRCLDYLAWEAESHRVIRLLERENFQSKGQAHQFLEKLMLTTIMGERNDRFSEEDAVQDRARAVIVDALECDDLKQRAEKGAEALKHWPQCAEAYILLAEAEDDLAVRIGLLEKGISIAEETTPAAAFKQLAAEGNFWRKLSTRAYMRCRAALALTLWSAGQKTAAIEHLQELLKLNPADNQGVRLTLSSWLLDSDTSEPAIDAFFERYEHDHNAFSCFSFLLWKYRRIGPGKECDKALKVAVEQNKFIPLFLAGTRVAPDIVTGRASRGSIEEAGAYCRLASNVWQQTPGAIEWLRRNCDGLFASKNILRKIDNFGPEESDGFVPAPISAQLRIGNDLVWM